MWVGLRAVGEGAGVLRAVLGWDSRCHVSSASPSRRFLLKSAQRCLGSVCVQLARCRELWGVCVCAASPLRHPEARQWLGLGCHPVGRQVTHGPHLVLGQVQGSRAGTVEAGGTPAEKGWVEPPP